MCYRIIVLRPFLIFSLKLKELEEEWEKLGNERGVPSRFLRSQQAQQEKLAAEATAAGQDNVDGKIVH